MKDTASGGFHFDEEWLSQTVEPVLEPDMPIIDAHHHLWDSNRGSRYLFRELQRDVDSGHNIRATLYAQCYEMYSKDAVPSMAPVGEVEFVNGVAARSASGLYGESRLCAGIVGYADLRLGEAVDVVLKELRSRAPNRFKGIRFITEWDEDSSIRTAPEAFPRGLMSDPTFRKGFSRLHANELTFDAWLFHTQIPELTDLARTFPDTTIVLDHIGAPLNVGRYADQQEVVRREWTKSIYELATCANVRLKIGGFNMHLLGFHNEHRAQPLSSDVLAEQWRPYIETCIDAFGPDRCMFESNFPVDKSGCSYRTLWNAFKRVTSALSPSERSWLFYETARQTYRLEL
ncbi:amidohydrolase family protein [Burkholderia multivorans]|nr:amidohydrolase family protein [Burkholderia multivorans]